MRPLTRTLLLGILGFFTLMGDSCTSIFCWGSPCGNSSSDSPGTVQTVWIQHFTQGNSDLCEGPGDCSRVTTGVYQPLTGFGWSGTGDIEDGVIWNGMSPVGLTPATTVSQILGLNANLTYISTHGDADVYNNRSIICLRDCNGWQTGNTVSVTSDQFPSAWNGPTWLIFDSCNVVQSSAGWSRVFGGSLHGILGKNKVDPSLTIGQTTFVNLIKGYDTALDAWFQAVKVEGQSLAFSGLIPDANKADAIEARGGPHFGFDGSTNPRTYYCCNANGGYTTKSAVAFSTPQTSMANLTAESMDENAWYNKYGGSSVPSVTSQPSANEHDYRNGYVMVRHFLASGGLVYTSASTGTAQGFSWSDAYSYATSWIANNGGLPSDAVLTYAGTATVDSPPRIHGRLAANNNTEYVFQWRHSSSGLLGNDSIVISVDDAGDWDQVCQSTWDAKVQDYVDKCTYSGPWVADYHVSTYRRLWRAISGYGPTPTPSATRSPQSISGTTSGYGYCGADMTDISTTAEPCTLYDDTSGGITRAVTSSGASSNMTP